MKPFTEEEKSILRMFFRDDAVKTAEAIYESMSVMEESPELELMRTALQKIMTSDEETLMRILDEVPMLPTEEDPEDL
ncbi:MAG: hypothetical protein IKD87_06385 [Oscillospiraceae bacterium]|nr:hypothetical protein [Oscillospiraceae bacterium]